MRIHLKGGPDRSWYLMQTIVLVMFYNRTQLHWLCIWSQQVVNDIINYVKTIAAAALAHLLQTICFGVVTFVKSLLSLQT